MKDGFDIAIDTLNDLAAQEIKKAIQAGIDKDDHEYERHMALHVDFNLAVHGVRDFAKRVRDVRIVDAMAKELVTK